MSRKVICSYECSIMSSLISSHGKISQIALNPCGIGDLQIESLPPLHQMTLEQGPVEMVTETVDIRENNHQIQANPLENTSEVTFSPESDEIPMSNPIVSQFEPEVLNSEVRNDDIPIPTIVETREDFKSAYETEISISDMQRSITPNRHGFDKIGSELETEMKWKSSDGEDKIEQSRTSFGTLNRQTSGRKKRESGESESSLSRQSSIRSRRSDDVDHRHAVAGTDSRVSSALIRQLSGKMDVNSSELVRQKSESSRNLLQVAALSWLEQQITEETGSSQDIALRAASPVGSPEQRLIHSPEIMRKSPVGFELKSSLKKNQRTPFSHSYSSVLEDRDDATTFALSKLFEGDLVSPRLPDDSPSINRTQMDSLNSPLSPSPELKQRSIKRRQSISTTAPRAYFDTDGDIDEKKDSQPNLISKFSSGKLVVPPIQIDTDNLDSPRTPSEEDDGSTFSPMVDFSNQRGPRSLGGQGIRRRNSIGSSTKRSRRTLSTIRSVQSWDDKVSAAEAIKANMKELIEGEESLYDEFIGIETSSGVEIWTVNLKQLSKVEDGRGVYYNHDCYLILTTSNSHSVPKYSIYTWTGSKSERDKQIIVAFKAQNLSKYLGGAHIQHNREGEETDDFFEAILGNFEVIEGTATVSSLNILEKSSSYRAKNTENIKTQARLLLVSTGSHAVLSLFGGSPNINDIPALRSIPIQRSSFQSQLALIFDTGDDIIFQWRGSLASQVSRARVFEAALSLRSERIKQNPSCRIEVVDDQNEPDYFWEAVDQNSTLLKSFPSKASSFGDELHSQLDEDSVDNESEHDECSSESSASEVEKSEPEATHDLPIQKPGYLNSRSMLSLELQEDEEEILYDIDEIKDYCSELIEGHSEMQRRQVISHSRILDPNMLVDIQEDDEKNKKNIFYDINQSDVNLYRIGYVEGQLHTSRLSGINSNGENLGKPRKEMLDSKGVYILDYNEEVYVWVGKLSPQDLRIAGMTVAKALVEHSKDKMIKVDPVNEGHEPILFKSKFPDWYETDLQKGLPRRLFSETADTMPRVVDSPPKSVIDSSVSYMRSYQRQTSHKKKQIVIRSKISLHENHIYDDILQRDDGSGVAVVWVIDGNELKSIPKNEHGHFWTHEAYVILYGFTPTNEETDEGHEEEVKPQFILYFWQGPHTKEKAYPQWKLSILPQKQDEWIKQMGEIPHEIRVQQGKEPLHFFRIFKHRYIVHIAFLDIIKRRMQAEDKVKRVQHDILKREKLRSFQFPVPGMIIRRVTGVFSPTNSRLLLNAARTSPCNHRSPLSPEKKSRHPFFRDGSFSTLEASVADDLSGHSTPVGKSQYQMEKANGVLLFQVKGSGLIDDDVHAVQIEACANRLNSSDCFIAVRPYRAGKSFVWLWVGRGSQFYEQEAAGSLAIKIMKWVDQDVSGNQVRVVEEGAGEWFNRWIAKSFYRALGGFCLYSNFDLLQTPRYLRPYPLRYPQLFVCELVNGEYNITMLERFCQGDLQPAGAAILEAHYALFVWYGRNSNTALTVTCKKIAQRFLGALRKGNCAVDRTVIEIQQDQETTPFISCFHGWCDWDLLAKPYLDPRKVRLDVRQSMGLMGDMKATQGRPIEGLTTEQHQVLAEEFKKRQKRLKEKEKEAKSQQDSVRVKIRQGHHQYDLEHRPPPEVKEVKKIIADASYNSPVCVPPPFAVPLEPKQVIDSPEEENSTSVVPSSSIVLSSSSPPSKSTLVSVQRSKSFNNLRSSPSPLSKSNSFHYQQVSIGRIEVSRSHSSNSLLTPRSPPNGRNSPIQKSISITERIRNARPQLTSRDRVNLFRNTPTKSTDYSTSSDKRNYFSKISFHSSPSNEYHEESITARIRRQRDQLSRTLSPPSPPPNYKKSFHRQLSPPTSPGQESEKKEKSITRLLAAAGLQRQRKKFHKM